MDFYSCFFFCSLQKANDEDLYYLAARLIFHIVNDSVLAMFITYYFDAATCNPQVYVLTIVETTAISKSVKLLLASHS